jgi:hypothetical protein
MRWALPVVMLVALGGCGSDSNNSGGSGPPTVSTPPPAVTVPLNGAYDLTLSPADSCGLPDTPYVLPVNVTTFATGRGSELRGTLSTGGDDLTLDMLYPAPGLLQGAISTRTEGTPLPAGGSIFLRDNGTGWVSLSADARAELIDGTMVGDVFYTSTDGFSYFCQSDSHSWSLIAR